MNPVIWYLVTGLITILFLTIAYFGKQTLATIENAVNKLTEAVNKLDNFMTLQTEKNKQFEELWAKVEKHDDDIKTISNTVTNLVITHSMCSKNHKEIDNGKIK